MSGSNSKTGGGATGTIRPSTSPRMPTSGFEVRGHIVRQRSPAFILKSTAGLNSSRSFASVRQCSPALLSPLLSKRRLYKFTAAVRSSAMPPSSAVDLRLRRVEDFHNSYSFRLVKFRRHLVEETGPQHRGVLPG